MQPTSHETGGPFGGMSKAEREWRALRHHKRFEVLHEVQKVRDFRLVLCADFCDSVVEHSVRVLKEAVTTATAKRVFDDFSSEPVVVYSPRANPPRALLIHDRSAFVYTRQTPR